MRAIRLHEFGGPDVMNVEEVPEPQAGDGEVLIEVETAGINFGDLLVREGAYMGRDSLPVIPGWEVCGRRADTGERVVALLVGNGYAERVAAPEKDVVLVPDDVPDAVALAMVIQGATAWHLLEAPRPVSAGEALLITGAGSGVTHMVVQLARLREPGAVIVCASAPDKAERVLELGADMVLHTDELGDQLTEAARVAAGPCGADVLIDCVGEPLFGALMRALRPGGRAVVYGMAGGTPAQVHTGALLKHGLTVSGLWLGHGGGEPLAVTLDRLFGLWREGKLEPTLGPELPLAEAPEAHRLVAARTGVGKVVLRVR